MLRGYAVNQRLLNIENQLVSQQKQLDEIKRQWKEEHKPEIIAYMTTHEIYFYICIKNTSRVPIHDIRVSVTHVPTKGIIPSKEYFLNKIDGASLTIESRRYSLHKHICDDDKYSLAGRLFGITIYIRRRYNI